MTDRLFVCVQIEAPATLPIGDGRHVLRDRPGGEPQHVLVLTTRPGNDRTPVRRVVSVIDPVSVPAESQAQRWLAELDIEAAVANAMAVIDRALKAQRIAAADPHVHPLTVADAHSIRAGWGTGKQMADGLFTESRELEMNGAKPAPSVARRLTRRMLPLSRPKRSAIDSSQRLAALLGGRTEALLCEELALRARHDLDRGDLRLAAVELERAYAAALVELAAELPPGNSIAYESQLMEAAMARGGTMHERLQELRRLNASVTAASQSALQGTPSAGAAAAGWIDGPHTEDPVTHALGRLEAALRARAAAASYGAH